VLQTREASMADGSECRTSGRSSEPIYGFAGGVEAVTLLGCYITE
jgi:hypothetical protein